MVVEGVEVVEEDAVAQAVVTHTAEEDVVVVDAVVDLLVVHQTLKKKFLLPIENRLRRKLKLQLNCKQCNVENI